MYVYGNYASYRERSIHTFRTMMELLYERSFFFSTKKAKKEVVKQMFRLSLSAFHSLYILFLCTFGQMMCVVVLVVFKVIFLGQMAIIEVLLPSEKWLRNSIQAK